MSLHVPKLAAAFVAFATCVVPTLAHADGDAAAGATVFARCSACHQVGAGASNSVGPHLNGLIGRPVASVARFAYSGGLLARAGEQWSSQNVQAYIADPGRFIGERSRMPAQRLRPDQVADLIAFLEAN